ncbi:MAG: hypothetical protein Fues2KO_47990 [Fuerstiella sp.]
MAQPFDQKASCEAAGDLDTGLGEFWLENPWQPTEHNLSAFERNRILLNTTDGRFADVSQASGDADLDSDSRSVVAADFTSDGMPDLLVRSSGGGPLRLFTNKFPQRNWVRISLQGTQSNRRGLGARLIAHIGQREICRELQAPSGFQGQSPPEVIFGLQDDLQIDRLMIEWPSGTRQQINSLAANHHFRITESESEPESFPVAR